MYGAPPNAPNSECGIRRTRRTTPSVEYAERAVLRVPRGETETTGPSNYRIVYARV